MSDRPTLVRKPKAAASRTPGRSTSHPSLLCLLWLAPASISLVQSYLRQQARGYSLQDKYLGDGLLLLLAGVTVTTIYIVLAQRASPTGRIYGLLIVSGFLLALVFGCWRVL